MNAPRRTARKEQQAMSTVTGRAVTAEDIAHDGRIDLPNGWYAIVRTERDNDMGAPWEEHDGHGPVSDWRLLTSKRAGERVLNHNYPYDARFYDFAEAIRIARKDGWGCSHGMSMPTCECHEVPGAHGGHVTRGEMAACAAESDFQRMRAWANDEWEWIVVTAELFDADGERVGVVWLWGVESDGDYWRTVAAELVNELAVGIVLPNDEQPKG